VGAAVEVLARSCEADRFVPLAMEATKSLVGHTETASGAVGLMQLAQTLQSASLLPLVHLRSLNPHVAGLLRMTEAKTALVPQRAPLASAAAMASRLCMISGGVGSFAFQGARRAAPRPSHCAGLPPPGSSPQAAS
jgi:hypothetical protein